MVESQPSKLLVAGSIPVSRSTIFGNYLVVIAFGVFPVALAAQDGSATISGVAVDRSGARIPHARAELQASGSETKVYNTDADGQGQYRFSGLPGGEYSLKLSSPGFDRLTVKSIDLAEAQKKIMPPLRLTVGYPCGGGDPMLDYVRVLPAASRGSNLGGSVRRDSWDGPPAVSARVILICETGKVCGTTKTNSEGAFLFRDINSGFYDIVVKHAGFYPLRVSRVEVEENREMIYSSFAVEHCFKGNCDPRLRPKKPLVVCE